MVALALWTLGLSHRKRQASTKPPSSGPYARPHLTSFPLHVTTQVRLPGAQTGWGPISQAGTMGVVLTESSIPESPSGHHFRSIPHLSPMTALLGTPLGPSE